MPSTNKRFVVADASKGTGCPFVFPNEEIERICSFIYDKKERMFLELTIDGKTSTFFGNDWKTMEQQLAADIQSRVECHRASNMKSICDFVLYEVDCNESCEIVSETENTYRIGM